MDLQSFLSWEVPVSTAGQTTTPQVYIIKKEKSTSTGYRWVFNNSWITQFLPEITTIKEKIGLAVSIDRKEKCVYIVFDPPIDVSQYRISNVYEKSKSCQLTNITLLGDLWTMFNFPSFVNKQFLTLEFYKEVENKKIFKVTYNPKSSENMQIMANSKKPKK